MSLPTLESTFSAAQIVSLQQYFSNLLSIKITEGNATVASGSSVVANPAALTTSNIQLTVKSGSITGHLTFTINNGVGFTITSSNGADSGTVDYLITN